MGEIVAYCAAAARATVMSVSPVESDTRCRWKKPLLRWIMPASWLWVFGEKGTSEDRAQGAVGIPPRSVHIGALPHPSDGRARWRCGRQCGCNGGGAIAERESAMEINGVAAARRPGSELRPL